MVKELMMNIQSKLLFLQKFTERKNKKAFKSVSH